MLILLLIWMLDKIDIFNSLLLGNFGVKLTVHLTKHFLLFYEYIGLHWFGLIH